MSSTRYQLPIDPIVARNQFRERPFAAAEIPPFDEIRTKLPQPVLPQQMGWYKMYWQAWQAAWQNLHQPKPDSGLIASYLSPVYQKEIDTEPHIYMWDMALISQFGSYARRAFDFMAGLDNFYAKQENDGHIGRELSSQTGQNYFHPFDPNSAGPNIAGLAEWRYFRRTGDDSRLEQVFWPLLGLHRWLRQNRTWQTGLYWATGMSSHMDNSPRVPDSNRHHRHWAWVDASMQAALSCFVLGRMAQHLNQPDFLPELEDEHQQLINLINEQMWSEALNFYVDLGPNGRFSRVKSVGAYWGLLDEQLVPEKRLTRFVQHLRDTWSFNLPHRIPSQAADSEGYNAMSGNYWRGAVWPTTNYMVLNGLRNVGQMRLAHDIAVNHLENVAAVFEETQTFWENYAPERAAPGEPAQHNFVGTTGLSPIAILLEDVIGITVDWPLKRVTWCRYLDTTETYGVRNYPLGQDGVLHLTGDAEQVIVDTDTPFTLLMRDRIQTLQTAVPRGRTVIRVD